MITIYGKENCPFCVRAKQLCEGYKKEYDYIDIEFDIDEDDFLRMKETIPPKHTTVPIIFRDGEFIGGFFDLAAIIQPFEI